MSLSISGLGGLLLLLLEICISADIRPFGLKDLCLQLFVLILGPGIAISVALRWIAIAMDGVEEIAIVVAMAGAIVVPTTRPSTTRRTGFCHHGSLKSATRSSKRINLLSSPPADPASSSTPGTPDW